MLPLSLREFSLSFEGTEMEPVSILNGPPNDPDLFSSIICCDSSTYIFKILLIHLNTLPLRPPSSHIFDFMGWGLGSRWVAFIKVGSVFCSFVLGFLDATKSNCSLPTFCASAQDGIPCELNIQRFNNCWCFTELHPLKDL